MKYIVTKEIKSETQVVWIIYLQDGAFLFIWTVLTFMLKENVYGWFQVPYILFSELMGIRMVLRAKGNPKRRYFQAIALYLSRPKHIYRYYKERREEKHSVKEKRDRTHKRKYA